MYDSLKHKAKKILQRDCTCKRSCFRKNCIQQFFQTNKSVVFMPCTGSLYKRIFQQSIGVGTAGSLLYIVNSNFVTLIKWCKAQVTNSMSLVGGNLRIAY